MKKNNIKDIEEYLTESVDITRRRLERELSKARFVTDAESLLEMYGEKKFQDENIDEAIDDDNCEDEYLMCESFDVINERYSFHVKLYYGNNTMKLNDFNIFEI